MSSFIDSLEKKQINSDKNEVHVFDKRKSPRTLNEMNQNPIFSHISSTDTNKVKIFTTPRKIIDETTVSGDISIEEYEETVRSLYKKLRERKSNYKQLVN